MCAPTYYDVDYVINPWMEGNVHAASKDRACEQWNALYARLSTRANVELVEGVKGSPDMVFTANAGLKFKQEIALSRFEFSERQGEAQHFKDGLKTLVTRFERCRWACLSRVKATPFGPSTDHVSGLDAVSVQR